MNATRTNPLAVQLPPPSPALTLHEAAAVLRALAAKVRTQMVSNDYWGMGWARGVENAIGGPEGVLAGLFTPDLADELADHLDATATAAVRHAAEAGAQEEITGGWPIRMAKRILGEAS